MICFEKVMVLAYTSNEALFNGLSPVEVYFCIMPKPTELGRNVVFSELKINFHW